MMLAPLFAEGDPLASLSGGAGWVGAGLLGLVLGWLLLIHLPAKDKRDKEKDEAKDAQINGLITSFQAELKEGRQSMLTAAEQFNKALNVVKDMAGENLDKQLNAFGARNGELRATMQEMGAGIKEGIRDQTGILTKGLERIEVAMGTVCEATALHQVGAWPRDRSPKGGGE